jgi:hypothetical protein
MGASGATGPTGSVGPIGPSSNSTVFAALKNTVTAATSTYVGFFSRNFGINESSLQESQLSLPMDCDFQNLFVESTNMNSGDIVDVTMVLNGADTSVTCHLVGNGNGISSSCSDANPAHAAPAMAGDLFTAKFVAPGTNTSAPALRVAVQCK